MSVIFVVWVVGSGDENLDNMDRTMSESRFRSRISQERMTEGWKGERNSMQKTTETIVVIKINLGGEKKRRERFKGYGRQKRWAEYDELQGSRS
jgi:hypothetical protein